MKTKLTKLRENYFQKSNKDLKNEPGNPNDIANI